MKNRARADYKKVTRHNEHKNLSSARANSFRLFYTNHKPLYWLQTAQLWFALRLGMYHEKFSLGATSWSELKKAMYFYFQPAVKTTKARITSVSTIYMTFTREKSRGRSLYMVQQLYQCARHEVSRELQLVKRIKEAVQTLWILLVSICDIIVLIWDKLCAPMISFTQRCTVSDGIRSGIHEQTIPTYICSNLLRRTVLTKEYAVDNLNW